MAKTRKSKKQIEGKRERASASLSGTLDNVNFLTKANKHAKTAAKSSLPKEIIKRAAEWAPSLAFVKSTDDLLTLPIIRGTEVDTFLALAVLLYSPENFMDRDCSKEFQRLQKASDDLQKASDALESAKKELAAADADLQKAVAELTKAEQDYRAAQENTNHQTAHLLFPDPYQLIFVQLAQLYEAVFRAILRKAQQKFDDATQQVKLKQELVKIRQQALDKAADEYAKAFADWLRCISGY